MKPTILLDFDGTLGLGTGPTTAYAREVARRTGGADFLERALAAIDAFEEGASEYLDGYDAVAKVAVAEGISDEILSASYAASREALGSPAAPVIPPVGLNRFLHEIRGRARLVLASNAPGDGITKLLQEWGVLELFAETHFTVGKPAGLGAIVQTALELGPVLSVGDIVANDLHPAFALGADTALVGPTADKSSADITLRGRTITDIYPQIAEWIDAAVVPLP